ncbi:tRNA lysidine(34) synthetase TilS [Candidatus Omnitrophota bacterium]
MKNSRTHRVNSKARSSIRKYDLLKIGDRVVVAVSGGPDSLSLLYVLLGLKEEMGLSLCVAHLNHMLRPKESKKDLNFVKTSAKKLNLPFYGKSVKVKKMMKKGSIEELARVARYDFLLQCAQTFKADAIALGHTKDDQAETVLMRIIRGTGLNGLQAMLPKRMIQKIAIIRPLLDVDRTEINSFLKRLKITPQVDSSNIKNIYFRNKVRNHLLPLLQKQYNPQIKDVLFDLSQNIYLDYEFIHEQHKACLQKIKFRRVNSNLQISRVALKTIHVSQQRLILRSMIEDLSATKKRIDYRHWKELDDLVYRRPVGSVVDLPHKLKATTTRTTLVLSKR